MTASVANLLAVFKAYREVLLEAEEDNRNLQFGKNWLLCGGRHLIHELLRPSRGWPLGILHFMPAQFWQAMGQLLPDERRHLCRAIPPRILNLVPTLVQSHVPPDCFRT